jgi:hypothetical protein
MGLLRVELCYDDEAGNWHYRGPAPHINGGGTSTREEAGQASVDAIAFAFQGDPHDFDTDAEAITLDVSAAPAA